MNVCHIPGALDLTIFVEVVPDVSYIKTIAHTSIDP